MRPPPRSFAHQPALDGVRGIAVALVLLFHAGFGWMSGGYVGVSVFFTLSGYLITSLALVERERTGRLDSRAFYARRVRRLLPASLACLAGVVVLATAGLFRDVQHLRRDLWAALAQVYNWVALAGGQSYADLVGGGQPAPLDHYWSLAVEEQFYWVWPLVLAVVLRHRPRGRIVLVGVVTLAAVVAAPVVAGLWGPDAAYWATPARLAEILLGALLAVVLHHRRFALPRRLWWLAGVGLAVIVTVAATWPAGSGPAYEGWLPVFALATVAVLLGLQVPSPLRRALAWRPLVGLGVISYGVYLYHWPIYAVLDGPRTGLGRPALFALRAGVTIAVAVVSFVALERPLRRARLAWRPTATLAAAACVVLALVVAMAPVDLRFYWAGSDADRQAAALQPVAEVAPLRVTRATTHTSTTSTTTSITTSSRPTTTVAETTTTSTVAETTTTTTAVPTPTIPTDLSRPARIIVLGDSTAWAAGAGMAAWAAEHPDVAKVSVLAEPGCGMIRDGLGALDEDDGFRRTCVELLEERLPDAITSTHPDVVVGMVTLRDIEDRVWDPAEGALTPLDDRFVERLRVDYSAMSAWLLAVGVPSVIWVVPPPPAMPMEGGAHDPARFERYEAALRAVAAEYPGQVEVVDLDGWLAAEGWQPERPDGLHLSPAAAEELAGRFLVPAAVTAVVTP